VVVAVAMAWHCNELVPTRSQYNMACGASWHVDLAHALLLWFITLHLWLVSIRRATLGQMRLCKPLLFVFEPNECVAVLSNQVLSVSNIGHSHSHSHTHRLLMHHIPWRFMIDLWNGQITFILFIRSTVANGFHRIHRLVVPFIQNHRSTFGDVRSQIAMHANAVDA
jgi:hypothetical protein